MFENEFAIADFAPPEKTSFAILDQLVAVRAYHYFEQRGCLHGSDLEDWIRAEREILAEMQPEEWSSDAQSELSQTLDG